MNKMNSMTSRPRLVRGFTLIELLLVIGILAVLGTITVLVINPAERLKETRDSQRLYDLKTLESLLNLSMTFAALEGKTIDLDGQNQNACKSQANQTVFFSVPTGQEAAPNIDGWLEKQAATADYRRVDGSGWVPIDFTSVSQSQSVPLSALPIDPLNTFNPDYYYTYVCGSSEFTARFESAKYQDFAAADGGDTASLFEVGSDLTLTPPLVPVVPPEIYSVTPSAPPDRDTTLSVTIAGDKFQNIPSNPTVSFSGGGITVSVNTVTENQIIAVINIDRNALSGARDVTVTNPDDGSATKADAFTVNKNSVRTGYLLGSSITTYAGGYNGSSQWFPSSSDPEWLDDENPPQGLSDLARAAFAGSEEEASPRAEIKNFNFQIPNMSSIGGICLLVDDTSIDPLLSNEQRWTVGVYIGSSFYENMKLGWDITANSFDGVNKYFYNRNDVPVEQQPQLGSCTNWGYTGWTASFLNGSTFAVEVHPENIAGTDTLFRFDVIGVNVDYNPP